MGGAIGGLFAGTGSRAAAAYEAHGAAAAYDVVLDGMPEVDTNCQAGRNISAQWDDICVWKLVTVILCLIVVSMGIFVYRNRNTNSEKKENSSEEDEKKETAA